MIESSTTSNGYEIHKPTAVISADNFRTRMSQEFGIDALSPHERINQLKSLSVEGIAILLEDINKSIQGSADSLMNHETVMKIGDKETIELEDRYNVFIRLIESIKESSDAINPARVADVLALGVVLLHPFHDGNGRTARALGLMFRDDYDATDYADSYNTIIEPRDRARERGGFLIFGYTPKFPEGFNQSDPDAVHQYLDELLVEEKQGAYLGPFGQAPLTKE